jgi:hypothetical protein
MHSDEYQRETNALLKAVDPARLPSRQWLVALARNAAADADNHNLGIGMRLDFRQELLRVMDSLTGAMWRLGEDGHREMSTEEYRQLCLDSWDFLQKHVPDDPLFQMFTRDDLLDELAENYPAELKLVEEHENA